VRCEAVVCRHVDSTKCADAFIQAFDEEPGLWEQVPSGVNFVEVESSEFVEDRDDACYCLGYVTVFALRMPLMCLIMALVAWACTDGPKPASSTLGANENALLTDCLYWLLVSCLCLSWCQGCVVGAGRMFR
jgi:hypothetical protein